MSEHYDYADRLRHAMRLASVDVGMLARELGVSYQAVAKVLDGRSKSLAAKNNSHAAKFLGVSPDWLATGAGDSRPSACPFSRELLAAAAAAGPDMARRAENAARAALGMSGLSLETERAA